MRPRNARLFHAGGVAGELALGRANLDHGRVGGVQLGQPAAQLVFFQGPGFGQGRHPASHFVGVLLPEPAHLDLGRIVLQVHLFLGHLLQHGAGRQLRHRHVGVLDRQPDHRHQIGDHQDDVLAHLRPRNGAHAAQERTDQHPPQRHEDAQFERNAGHTRGDDAHAIDLRHQVGEGTEDGAGHTRQARHVAAIARAHEIGDGVLAEAAQIRRQQHRHQHVAARPAHDVGQPAVTGQVQRAGHADEGRHRHPIGGRGHAVVDGGHPAAGHVVLGLVGRPADDADARIQADRDQQEHIADPVARHAEDLGQRHQQDHQGETRGVQHVDPPQSEPELLGRISAEKRHQRLSPVVSARSSARFMTRA
ncbi:hypothetical protein FQZ97_568050 [compost metagenome]